MGKYPFCVLIAIPLLHSDHQKYDLFMSKIGEHLATKQGLPDRE